LAVRAPQRNAFEEVYPKKDQPRYGILRTIIPDAALQEEDLSPAHPIVVSLA